MVSTGSGWGIGAIFGGGSAVDSALYVDSRVGTSGSGSAASPFKTIQEGFTAAQAGDIIEVVSGSGPYDENVATVRSGTSSAPITLVIPSTVKFRGGGTARSMHVNHSHIHLLGGDYDGLWNPGSPNSDASYRDKLIYCVPTTTTYLTGLVIKPDKVGNCSGEAIRLKMVDGAEVGGFSVAGKGAGYEASTGAWVTNGEVVYIGTSPSQIGENPGGGIDASRNIWVHDIDGTLSGCGYSELVNVKEGCSEGFADSILIEDCHATKAKDVNAGAFNLQGTQTVLQNCSAIGNLGAGVRVSLSQTHVDAPNAGTDNTITLNTLQNNAQKQVKFPNQVQADQKLVCGNTITGATDGTPAQAC